MKDFEFDSEKREIKHPFTVPDGYFDGFTDSFMSQLPEKAMPEEKKITLWARVSPWVYMAAMFAGMALFLRTFVSKDDEGKKTAELTFQDTANFRQIITEMSEDEFFDIMDDQATSASYYQTLLSDSKNY
ncbi:MAG: hypothetical protein PUB21_08210 [Bacteroidales bacterium]|nr:hypothetical protein [Bacteroidales bacterium]